jgi:hypothetical protein
MGATNTDYPTYHGLFETVGDFETTAITLMVIPDPKTNPVFLNVGLRVVNRAPSPISFTFLTTQVYDIELVDVHGRVVSKWSDGRAFGDVVTTRDLPPCSSWYYLGKVSLVDAGGSWIPSGDYTARMYLTANRSPGAQAPLSVQIGIR